LAEHWGHLDESVNRDLDDIARSYSDGIFLVAKLETAVVGTGGLLPRSVGVGEILRMSVARELRRRGIASQVLRELIAWAPKLGISRIVLETTAIWREVAAFYLANGFTITHQAEGPFGLDTWFAREI
jgi:GNAT superfamily N-acetyltransferase